MRAWPLAMLLVYAARAERLPLTHFGSVEGLPSPSIHRMVRDSRGYIWLCTADGVAFFDGYEINPVKELRWSTKDIAEAKDGSFWLATRDGVVHYAPKSVPQIHSPGPSAAERFVNVVQIDSGGVVWAGTDAGLYRLDANGRFQTITLPASPGSGRQISAILQDRHGTLWVGGVAGLFKVTGASHARHEAGTQAMVVLGLAEAPDGRLWIGTEEGACPFDPVRESMGACLTKASGLPGGYVQSILAASDGSLWIGTLTGLAHVTSASSKAPVRQYGVAHGLTSANVSTLAEDSNGDVWIGTDGAGAMRLTALGFTSYGREEGLDMVPLGVAASKIGGTYPFVFGKAGETLAIGRLAGERFVVSRLPMQPGPGWGQVAEQDAGGAWWLATAVGAARLWRDHAAVPAGWPRGQIFRIFLDSRGNVWMSTSSRRGNQLLMGSPARATVTDLTHEPGLPDLMGDLASSFAEDAHGDIWIGFLHTGVVRYRNGSFTAFAAAAAPSGGVRSLHASANDVWVGTSRQGLCRIDTREPPQFQCFGVAQGLSNDSALCVVSDASGRIYAGTGKGVDRLDPATNAVRHFSTADGLVSGEVQMSERDSSGALWFGTSGGVSRLMPSEDRKGPPPLVEIRGFSVNGNAQRLSDLGEPRFGPLDLASGQNQIQIQFGATGSNVRYSYQLEGAWSPPSPERNIRYAQMAPGPYRFRVRAVDGMGTWSHTPAEATFTIAAPLWRRWWFQVLLATALAGVLYGAHRFRVAQLIALERIRLRIATDLHDDIGASLSQVSILSEAARRDVADSGAAEAMAKVASISREVVDSMSEIVWAINPQRDHLRDLVQRMRRFASDVLSAKDIEFVFLAPSGELDRRIPVDARRQALLIFKEAINNVAKHSRAAEARIEFRVKGKVVWLEIVDNGRGFETAGPSQGNGLDSMKRRAQALGGTLTIENGGFGGKGVTVRATFPLK